jgi:FMN phosphatase YigB (HAD superfamily)
MVHSETPHISLDLWDTILRRRCHPDEVKLHTAQRMLHLLSPYLGVYCPGTMELLRRRQRIEAKIGSLLQKEGFDDEYEIEEVLSRCILDLAEKSVEEKELATLTDILVRGEINQEIAVTYLDEDLISLLASCKYEKIHIISDFYMSADKVRTILQAHSFPLPVDTFFLSCDSKLNKRSGRLFKHVCSTLGVEPGALLHIGDNPLVDVEMASKSGLKTYHFIGNKEQAARQQNQDFFTLRQQVNEGSETFLLSRQYQTPLFSVEADGECERLHRYGRFMSPLFVGFALYIQDLCQAGGHERVHFFTREGKFFQKVFDRVQLNGLFGMPPIESRLLPVSRLATFFPSLQELTDREMMRLWSQYHTQSVRSFLESLGASLVDYLHVIQENGIDPEEMINSPWQDKRFLNLLADRTFLDHLQTEQREKRNNLIEFFHDCQFGQEGKAFIVDIGWRGTIQDNLALIFPNSIIEGCYLGLQRFFNPQPVNTRKYGYIADRNRGESHVMLKHVMPFEMLCFGTGGSAVGYRREASGMMAPEFQCDPEEDRIHNERIHYFQEGVVAGVEQVCRIVSQHGISIRELRAEANVLATHFLTSPPMEMCRAFSALKQDDTFGMARTIFPGKSSFRLSDRMLSYISSVRRDRFLSDLEKSGWPQYLLRSRYFGIFHHVGNVKKWLLKSS